MLTGWRRCGLLMLWMVGWGVFARPIVSCAGAAPADKSTFTDLDDEAETGGYDVSAQLTALPVEWGVARQENGDGYYVDFTPDAISLSVQESGKKVLLVRRAGHFMASKTEPQIIILQRRANRWNVIWQNRVVLRAEDDQFMEGPVGWKGSAGAVQEARLQPTEAPFFDDDFMRVSEEAAYEQAKPNPRNGMVIRKVKVDETIWSTVAGKWKTTGISENEQAQVAQSANPFAFQSSAKEENLALAGRPFWSDYSLSAAVKPQGAAGLGLVMYAQDAQNYLLFVWKNDGEVQLRSVVGGKTLVLAGSRYDAYESGQWYRLECRMHSGLWRAYIDGQQVLRADTGWFGQGRIGVYSQNPTPDKNAVFDDVHVRAAQDVLDQFNTPVAGRWHVVTGKWQWNKNASPLGNAVAMAVMGERHWSNYSVDASAYLPDDGVVGLISHRSPSGYYLFRAIGSHVKSADAGTAILQLIQGKTTKTLARVKIKTQFDNKSTFWSFTSDHGYLRVTDGLDRAVLLEAFDETFSGGQPGIYAHRGQHATPRFDGVLVHFPQERQVWAKIPELYEDPLQAKTMGEWSTPEGSWIPTSPISPKTQKVSQKDAKTLWNKGLFWGDGDVTFTLPALTEKQQVEVLLGDASKPDDAKSTFTLQLTAEGQTLHAQLLQGGAAVASADKTFTDKLEGQTLTVSRRGAFIIVRIGGADAPALLVYKTA